jgi:hypothetical protein
MMKSVFEKQGILLSIAAERRNRKQMKRKFYLLSGLFGSDSAVEIECVLNAK